jgi:hypothetical protein
VWFCGKTHFWASAEFGIKQRATKMVIMLNILFIVIPCD